MVSDGDVSAVVLLTVDVDGCTGERADGDLADLVVQLGVDLGRGSDRRGGCDSVAVLAHPVLEVGIIEVDSDLGDVYTACCEGGDVQGILDVVGGRLVGVAGGSEGFGDLYLGAEVSCGRADSSVDDGRGCGGDVVHVLDGLDGDAGVECGGGHSGPLGHVDSSGDDGLLSFEAHSSLDGSLDCDDIEGSCIDSQDGVGGNVDGDSGVVGCTGTDGSGEGDGSCICDVLGGGVVVGGNGSGDLGDDGVLCSRDVGCGYSGDIVEVNGPVG